jgi:hypothetical protein
MEYQDSFANPFIAAERGYIDEVIMPWNTRYRISRALNMLRNKKEELPWKKHDNRFRFRPTPPPPSARLAGGHPLPQGKSGDPCVPSPLAGEGQGEGVRPPSLPRSRV